MQRFLRGAVLPRSSEVALALDPAALVGAEPRPDAGSLVAGRRAARHLVGPEQGGWPEVVVPAHCGDSTFFLLMR